MEYRCYKLLHKHSFIFKRFQWDYSSNMPIKKNICFAWAAVISSYWSKLEWIQSKKSQLQYFWLRSNMLHSRQRCSFGSKERERERRFNRLTLHRWINLNHHRPICWRVSRAHRTLSSDDSHPILIDLDRSRPWAKHVYGQYFTYVSIGHQRPLFVARWCSVNVSSTRPKRSFSLFWCLSLSLFLSRARKVIVVGKGIDQTISKVSRSPPSTQLRRWLTVAVTLPAKNPLTGSSVRPSVGLVRWTC